MKLQIIATIVAVFILPTICLSQRLQSRINEGIPIDKFSRFSHHVSIHTITSKNSSNVFGDGLYGRDCSGSIIGEQWILTSISCIYGGIRYRLDFQRLYLNETKGSYSILIDNSYIYQYPTEYDDIALIQIPLKFNFYSKSPNERNLPVQPISLYNESKGASYNLRNNQFAVLPGFATNKDKLTYGMFRIIDNSECKNYYGNQFDEYYQLCTKGWNNIREVPCQGNEGGGLLIGWPRNPQLIGVFSTPLSCQSNVPAVYMKVSKYIDWIENIMRNDYFGTTPIPNAEWMTTAEAQGQ